MPTRLPELINFLTIRAPGVGLAGPGWTLDRNEAVVEVADPVDNCFDLTSELSMRGAAAGRERRTVTVEKRK